MPDKSYRVAHNLVGPFPKGSVIKDADLKPFNPDDDKAHAANIDRLLEAGAIVPDDDEHQEDVPERLTLSQAQRSENTPTLPNAAGIDTTPEEVAHVMDERDSFSGNPLEEGDTVVRDEPRRNRRATPAVTAPEAS